MPDTDLQLPDLHYRAKLTVIGLELPPDIDYAQWCEVGRVRTDGCPPATATVDHPADARAEDHRADRDPDCGEVQQLQRSVATVRGYSEPLLNEVHGKSLWEE